MLLNCQQCLAFLISWFESYIIVLYVGINIGSPSREAAPVFLATTFGVVPNAEGYSWMPGVVQVLLTNAGRCPGVVRKRRELSMNAGRCSSGLLTKRNLSIAVFFWIQFEDDVKFKFASTTHDSPL